MQPNDACARSAERILPVQPATTGYSASLMVDVIVTPFWNWQMALSKKLGLSLRRSSASKPSS